MNHEPRSIEWSEDESNQFLKYGHLFVPEREQLAKVFCDLIPAQHHDTFTVVDVGVGGGWLTEAILKHFPNASVIALDGSQTMLKATQNRLQEFADRIEFQSFNLFDKEWYLPFRHKVKCFVSSLVLHHLDQTERAELFEGFYQTLVPGGALIYMDLVKEKSEYGRRHMARAWNEETARRSLQFLGDLSAYEAFQELQWNPYVYSWDHIDRPSSLLEQLKMIEQAGFQGVDAFWVKAGHAVMGGYK
ncbi:class I SAM-dependent methyltransferase [Thermoflavimicrobium daqui]|uniref:16S rRNA (Cytosine(1402)-N(4))-methyltransferase n=1 Tax=Thermoflavimicrobium daqui TaxID=2137476 RepID=A0A364K1Q2_9BACL|nr:class I SAM-dependent methyltransferase [Thermoflavimicrobium daqui]RAL21885.1 16S rRNA (cytosine(1402)-N(4))-methyltransferase [Thermoflavimicrobium daqui]